MTIFAGDKERNLANTVMDWLLAVPRLAELVREVVVRDDFSADLLCPDCVWPEVLLLDSFMTFKELSET